MSAAPHLVTSMRAASMVWAPSSASASTASLATVSPAPRRQVSSVTRGPRVMHGDSKNCSMTFRQKADLALIVLRFALQHWVCFFAYSFQFFLLTITLHLRYDQALKAGLSLLKREPRSSVTVRKRFLLTRGVRSKLTCSPGQPTGQTSRPKSQCEQHRDSVQSGGEHGIGAFIPECDADGRYRPLQVARCCTAS